MIADFVFVGLFVLGVPALVLAGYFVGCVHQANRDRATIERLKWESVNRVLRAKVEAFKVGRIFRRRMESPRIALDGRRP